MTQRGMSTRRGMLLQFYCIFNLNICANFCIAGQTNFKYICSYSANTPFWFLHWPLVPKYVLNHYPYCLPFKFICGTALIHIASNWDNIVDVSAAVTILPHIPTSSKRLIAPADDKLKAISFHQNSLVTTVNRRAYLFIFKSFVICGKISDHSVHFFNIVTAILVVLNLWNKMKLYVRLLGLSIFVIFFAVNTFGLKCYTVIFSKDTSGIILLKFLRVSNLFAVRVSVRIVNNVRVTVIIATIWQLMVGS